jgi:hypothetical protein
MLLDVLLSIGTAQLAIRKSHGLCIKYMFIVLNCLIICVLADDGTLSLPEQAEQTDYNVALGKQASQSTSYSGNPANLAIDDSAETCSRTFEEKGATWTVDLGETHIISRIEIVTG